MRCAIHFIPAIDHPLTVAAARWLGRDPYTGARVTAVAEGLIADHHAYLTAAPRRFGFHGCLKAPFALVGHRQLAELEHALDRFSQTIDPVHVPATRIAMVDQCFALLPVDPVPALGELAGRVVIEFDSFRRPFAEEESKGHSLRPLNARQLSYLLAWGCPDVLDQFRFHMMLTGPVERDECEHVSAVLHRFFGPLAGAPMLVDQIALFIEPEPSAPLLVHSVHPLKVRSRRKRA